MFSASSIAYIKETDMRTRQGIVFLLLLAAFCCRAETLRLNPDGQWQNLANDPQGQYFLALSDVKQKLSAGDKGQSLKALQKLRTDFKDMSGPDLDAYIEAETLYAKRNWSKATKKFQEFVKAWPESPFYTSANERLFSIGTAFLLGQKRQVLWILWLPAFDEGVNIMRDIADRAGTGPMGLRALTVLAETYERKKLYPEAYEVWSEVADKWPTGDVGEKALLRMAQCLHAAYKGPWYDATWLVSAKAYYEDFRNRYPQKAQQIQAGETIGVIVEQQAYKNYSVARYYDKTDHPLAANLYYQYVLKTWPDSRSARMTEQAQQEGYKHPKTLRRKLFIAGNQFLDSGFGFGLLYEKFREEE
jgi:outer membrane protein assembly factor BamD (BamD/ComL family)